jgi:hypothetical protein
MMTLHSGIRVAFSATSTFLNFVRRFVIGEEIWLRSQFHFHLGADAHGAKWTRRESGV